MKEILLLTTGGTIAAEATAGGLAPANLADTVAGRLREMYAGGAVHHEPLMELDSSNIQPEEWQRIARRVHAGIGRYDGFVITHGTDTMAYTASALGFMLQNLPCGVVLTGSQMPITDPLTDGATNLYTAVAAIEAGIRGVCVAFNRKVINGTRATKVSTMGFDAFESINAEYMAQVYADGLRVSRRETAPQDPQRPAALHDALCGEVFLLKLIPGTRPEIFDALLGMGYRGLVIEAFGAGGLHYVHRDLLSRLAALVKAGVPVVVCSQCLYERSDLSLYEVGQRLLAASVIPAGDMTSEAACTKLMWALGQTDDAAEVARMFATSYAGEISL